MSEEMMQTSPFECPAWFDGKKINETVFCEEFLRDYPMVTVNDAFFTVNGRVHDENRLKKVIYDRIKYYVTSGVAKKVTNLLDVMRMECCTAKLSLYQDRIHVANGTYYLNGTFSPEKDFCRNRLPVAYNPDAPQPVTWLHFLRRVTASVKIGKRSSVTTTISLISWNQRDISGAKRMRPSAPRISMKSTGCGARKTPLHR